MPSAEDDSSSRYVPPHRRQTPQRNRQHHEQQSWTPQTTPSRFHPSPSLPSSTRSHYPSNNNHNRRRPRDNASWRTPQKYHPSTPFSAPATLSATAPVWTPNSFADSIVRQPPSTTIKSQNDDVLQAASLFSRIVCINLIRRPDRWRTFEKRMRTSLNHEHDGFASKVERFAAVDGQDVMPRYETDDNDPILPMLEWDATQNAQYDKHIQPPMNKQMTPGEVGCAMSHVQLWQELAEMETMETIREDSGSTMLILEDDAILYQPKNARRRRQSQTPDRTRNGRHCDDSSFARNNSWRNNSSRSLNVSVDKSLNTSLDRSLNASLDEGHESMDDERIRMQSIDGDNASFIPALLDVWKILPQDWDILYLGFSDRGERQYIERPVGEDDERLRTTVPVRLFRPTYGFHTHAYALTQRAARVLVENLPVQGPLDVWLADHQWFDLNVYCACIEDGTSFRGKRGAQLISQQRHNSKSDIGMSGRVSM